MKPKPAPSTLTPRSKPPAGAFGGLADKGFSKAPLAEMQKINLYQL